MTRLRLGRRADADDQAEDHDDLTEQAEQRRRRRARQSVVYGGGFDLTTELAEILTPLADRVAAEPLPAGWLPRVAELTEATHAAIVALADLLAEADALRRTRHLEVAQRGHAVRLLCDLARAQRPDRPAITADDLTAGSWSATLTELARSYSEPLADLLARAVPPGQTRGLPSVSEKVEAALRQIDSPAIGLRNTLDSVAAERAGRQTTKSDRRSSEAIAAELAELGVEA